VIVYPDDANMAEIAPGFMIPLTALGLFETARAYGTNAIINDACNS